MTNREVNTAPVPDDLPVHARPGDFEPKISTPPVVVDEPPAAGQQEASASARNPQSSARR